MRRILVEIKYKDAVRVMISSLWKRVGVVAVAVVSCFSGFAQQENRLTQAVNNQALVTLKGTVHPLANGRNDRGAASADMQLDRLQLVLKRSPQLEASLQQRLRDIHTLGSANYHQWLTPEEFGKQFGPSDADVQTIESWLETQGLQVMKVNPGKQTLEIAGTVGAVQKAFHTSIHKFVVNGEQHFANTADPQIPVALAPVLGGFVSLNNFHVRHYSRFLGSAQYDPKTHRAIPEWTLPGGTLGHTYAVGPEDFATQYDVTPLYTATKPLTGTGQTIAIINESNINANVVNNFRSLFGLPASTPQVIIDGNDPGIDGNANPDGANGASGEAYLDVEWSGAVAPGATIDLVIAGDTSLENGLFLAMQRAVYSNLAPVMSISFGECEFALGSTNSFLQALWEQAAAQGITVMVSTGDSGSAGCDNPNAVVSASQGLAVNGFASTPFNVAIGGTDFDYAHGPAIDTYWNATNDARNGSLIGYTPEQVWNDSQFGENLLSITGGTISGGSGGASTCGLPTVDTNGNVTACAPTPKPAWQVASGVPADKARDIPDLSLFAANGVNGSFYAVCAADGDCQGTTNPQISGFGGTSVASPAFAGIMALVNQAYGPQGQANYVLYPLAAKTPTAFHDVVYGTGQMPCTAGTPNCTNGELTGFAATAGYDLATGLGSIDANVLVTNWQSARSGTATTTTLTPSSTSFAHGTTITLKAAVSGSGGTPTGDVAVLTDSPLASNQAASLLTLASGAASGTIDFLPGGTYNIWGSYAGDGTFAPSVSSKTAITVTPEASTLSLQVTTTSQGQSSSVAGVQVPYGTPVTLNAQPVPTTAFNCSSNCPGYTSATGTVAFTDSGNALNTVVLNASGFAEYKLGIFAVGNHSIAATYAGDASYNKSSSTPATVAFTVVKGTTDVSVSSALTTISQGQTTILQALVATAGGGAAPTGSVTFMAGSTKLGTGTLSAVANSFAAATYTVTSAQSAALPVGAVALTGTYGGDANYSSATSATPGSVTVTAASALQPSTTTVAASATTGSPAAAISLLISVKGKAVTPTGTVDLQSAGVDLTPGGLALTAGTAAGTAVASYVFDNSSASLLQGNNAVVVTYSGDAVYQASQATQSLTNPLVDFSMVTQTPTVTLAPGASGTATLNLGSINGFSDTVALTCTTPSGLTCSLNPASVQVSGLALATVNITASVPASGSTRADLRWPLTGGIALGCVLLFAVPGKRRRLFALILVGVVGLGVGCGGGGGSGGQGTTPPPTGPTSPTATNTPAGSYTVVVTGKQGSSVAHAIPITVVVKAAS